MLLADAAKYGGDHATAALALNGVLLATIIALVVIDVVLVVINVRLLLEREAPSVATV